MMNGRMNSFSKTRGGGVVLVPPLLFVAMPRLNYPGWQYLSFSAYYLIVGVLFFLGNRKAEPVARSSVMRYVIGCALAIVCSQTMSFLASPYGLSPADAMDGMKYVGFIIVALCGYRLGQRLESKTKQFLWRLGAAILVIEAVVQYCGIRGIPYVSWIYASDKEKAIGEGLRLTGTLGNPNLFGWIVCQATIMCLLGSGSVAKKAGMFSLGFLGVVLSGSKATLVAFCGALLLVGFSTRTKGNAWVRTMQRTLWVVFSVASIMSLFLLLREQGELFSYTAKILLLFQGSELQSLSSVSARLGIWESANSFFHLTSGVGKYFLGLGPTDYFACLDNDYLYTFYRTGLLGMLLSYGMWLRVLGTAFHCRSLTVGCFVMQAVLMAMLLGLQADTINGWNYSAWLGYFIGIMAAVLVGKRPESKAKPLPDNQKAPEEKTT